MRASIAKDSRGGAVVEMAIGTLIFVPLAFYGIWFADTLHFGIRAQEASMLPAWDVTAKLLHNEASGLGSQDQNVAAAAGLAQTAVLTDMETSFDSANSSDTPVKQSVFARASTLSVTCGPASGTGAAPNGSVDWGTGGFNDPNTLYLPNNTWVNCTSSLGQNTTGIPGTYAENFADGIPLFPGVGLSMSMCGIGPGITGCANGGAQGFWLFTDDWGCEDGSENALSIGSPGGNTAYFTVAQMFWGGTDNPGDITAPIEGWGDLGQTPNFRLTYRRGPDGSYDDPYTEGTHGQSGPHGGAANTHTGGPWHDEGAPVNVGMLTFNSPNRANNVYMAVQGWPSD